jgi:signal transduction histidine kinase
MTSVIASLRKITLAVIEASTTGQVENVLQEIAHTARGLINTRYAALGIPDGSGRFSHFLISGLTAEEFARIPHLPEGKGLLGAVMHSRRPLRLAEISEDPRSSGFPPNHPHMSAFLGVPVQIGEHLLGMLYLTDKLNGEQFTDDDQVLVETLATYAALAIGGIDLTTKQMRVTLLEERERIAMELHDSIIQTLYAVGMELQLLKGEIDQPEKLVAPIRHLDDVIAEIRRYIMNLKSAESHRQTVYQALRAVVDKLHAPPTLNVVLEAAHEYPPFDSATFESLCHICSEVASNAIRHARAKNLHVLSYRDRSDFVLQVEDDGIGFDAQQIEPGLGLANIRRRVQLHGGMIEIYSGHGSGGTRVRITFPIR